MTDTPNINRFTTNLTQKIAANPDDYQTIGRDTEVRKMTESLLRRTKNSPVLVGEPGVGKTAIVEGLVKKQLANALPARLNNAEVVELSVAALQGPTFLQDFEALLQELKTHRSEFILFIDEVHMIMGAGDQKGTLDMGNLLKPSLARGDFMLISATTQDEYQAFIEQDGALERRLEKVVVREPSVPEALTIMQGLKPTMEEFYQLTISDKALSAAVKLSKRYDA